MAKFVLHHVGGVLGPAEAGLDEREAGLHEDHEHGAEDDPQQVDLLARASATGSVILGAGHGRVGQQHERCLPPRPTRALVRSERPPGHSGTRTSGHAASFQTRTIGWPDGVV